MSYLITLKIGMIALHFQLTLDGKKNYEDKIFNFERHAWDSFCESHPDMRVAHSFLKMCLLFASGHQLINSQT